MIWERAQIYLSPRNVWNAIQPVKLEFISWQRYLYPISPQKTFRRFDRLPPPFPIQSRQGKKPEDSTFVTTKILYSEKNQQKVNLKVKSHWGFTRQTKKEKKINQKLNQVDQDLRGLQDPISTSDT